MNLPGRVRRCFRRTLWPGASALTLAAVLSACDLPLPEIPDSPDGDQATNAVQTVEAILTEAAVASPSPAPLLPSQVVEEGETMLPPATPDDNCEHRAGFVGDVTIRDNAEIPPGESFVKVWRLRNASRCVWGPDYNLVFFGGQRLGASQEVPLSTRVQPGETVDIAVEMTAPPSAGAYQGFWKLRSPGGEYFGIGPQGDQSFWVKIIVPAAATSTPGPASSITPQPTASPTPTGGNTPTPSPTPTEQAAGARAPAVALELSLSPH